MTHLTKAYLCIAVVTCPIEQDTRFIIPLPQLTVCKWTDIELHRRREKFLRINQVFIKKKHSAVKYKLEVNVKHKGAFAIFAKDGLLLEMFLNRVLSFSPNSGALPS